MQGIPSKKTVLTCLAALAVAVACAGAPAAVGGDVPWKEADDGLLVAEFEQGGKTPDGPPGTTVTVVKIDPKMYSFRLLCASELDKEKLTAKEWCEKYHLAAAVNAGMFQEDGFTSVGYMKNFGYVNNPRLSKANTILAFNPVDAGVPEVQIIDRECQDFSELRPKYRTMVQSIRMISCSGQNVWSPQDSKWSTAAVAMDSEGKMLVIFGKTPVPVHELVEILRSLPLSLKSAMYLEGGPQASLYLNTPKMTVERNGVWEGFEQKGAFQFSLPIPNVIGITRKARSGG